MARTRRKKNAQRRRLGFTRRLRTNLLAGILITAPIGITFYLSWLVIGWIDGKVTPIIPEKYNPETYLRFSIPGLGLVVAIIVLILIGALTKGVIGRWWLHTTEGILARMPVIRSLYGAVKQIFETIMKQQSNAFRQVVLFEYPRRGSWAIGFITGRTEGEVQSLPEDEVVNVFLPTTPNPTSGYLLFISKKDLVMLDMTVEEGIKMVVSGGIVTPPDRRAEEDKTIRRVASADGERKTIPYQRDATLEVVGDDDEPESEQEPEGDEPPKRAAG
jgi:uncharacterized membrane protein